MDTRQILGWNLRRLRVAKGISQERLALEAGIDRAYVGRVERAKENVTVATLDALAVVLGVPVAELFSAFDETQLPAPSLKAGRKRKEQSRA